MAEEKKLQQTKSRFKLRGIVTSLSDRSLRTGETGSGKPFKALRFGVKTSENNVIFVELFGMKHDYVYPYNQKEKKGLKWDFDKRDELPEGYHLIAVRTSLDENSSDAIQLVEWDAIDEIQERLENGDSVYVGGEISFNTFTTQQGDTVQQTQYQVKSISKQESPIDFEDEKFKELNSFEQEIVFVGGEKQENEYHILGRTIDYKEDFTDAPYIIDLEQHKKLAGNVHKKLKFGDLIKLKGLCWNKAVVEEIEEEEDDWGGDNPEGMGDGITRYESMLQVTNVDTKTWVQGKYQDDDFEKFVEEDDGFSGTDEGGDDPFNEEVDSEDPFA